MPGGLLNIIGVGQQDVILTGNPTKTFWKSNYSKYTNFGMQKFRLEYDGQKTISLTNNSQFTFKFKRYGDLVADTYMGINLPHIWSPLHQYPSTNGSKSIYYIPYEFQWIKHVGTQLIKSIEVNVGGQTLQKYSGDYLTAMIERDLDKTKQELINRMTGNLPEFNDPANAFQRKGRYPNAVYNNSPGGSEPSIRGRTLYIPLNAWFNLNTKQAFPLVSLQYNELTVTVTLRPMSELFTIRDVKNPGGNFPRIAPNFNEPYQEMYNFLQSPPQSSNLLNKNTKSWNANIHLITTYVFLGEDERRLFATQPQEYLMHDIHETTFEGISVNEILDLKSMGLVSSWMWFARRDDAYKRNQWTNYTNWDYENMMPSPSRVPPINDPSFNATQYLVTPDTSANVPGRPFSVNTIGYNPPPIITLMHDLSRVTRMLDIKPLWNEQGQPASTSDPLQKLNYSIPPARDPFINFWDGNAISRWYEHPPQVHERDTFSFSTTGVYTVKNTKNIMTTTAIIVDGKYRENLMDAGVYNYIEKYTRTSGTAKDGLYCYNFTLDTNPRNVQPTGAMNCSKFTKIELELTTISPPINKDNIFNTICRTDERTLMREPIGVIQSYGNTFKYRFEIIFMEERYNIIKFIGGNVGLVFSN